MMKKEASDLAGNNNIKDKNVKIVFAEDGRKRVWKEHMEAIMNEENLCDRMVNVEGVEGPMEPFAMNEVEKALGIMKNSKAKGPTGIVKKHLAASPHGKQVISQIVNKIFNQKLCFMTGRQVQLFPFIRRKETLWTVRAIKM